MHGIAINYYLSGCISTGKHTKTRITRRNNSVCHLILPRETNDLRCLVHQPSRLLQSWQFLWVGVSCLVFWSLQICKEAMSRNHRHQYVVDVPLSIVYHYSKCAFLAAISLLSLSTSIFYCLESHHFEWYIKVCGHLNNARGTEWPDWNAPNDQCE